MSSDEFAQFSLPVVLSKIAARRWIVITSALLLFGLSGLVGRLWPMEYVATSVVTVSPITITPFTSTPVNQQINIETERNVVSSTSVASAAARSLADAPSAATLLQSLQVTSPPDSQVLRISYKDPSAGRAALVADAFANAYLRYRSASADDLAQKIIKRTQDRIDELTAALPKETTAQTASQVASIQQQILTLREQQRQLSSVALNPGQVIGPADVPSSSSSPKLALFLAGGGALGILLGLVLALLREQTDRRVRRPDRLADALHGEVVVRDPHEPDETARRVLMMVTAHVSPGASAAASPMLVDVTSVDEYAAGAPVAAELAAAARGAGRTCLVQPMHERQSELVDQGWPSSSDRARWQVDVVFLDSRMLHSATRRELLAHRSDSIVLCVSARSRLEDVGRWLEGFERAGGQLSAVLFVEPKPRFGHRKFARQVVAQLVSPQRPGESTLDHGSDVVDSATAQPQSSVSVVVTTEQPAPAPSTPLPHDVRVPPGPSEAAEAGSSSPTPPSRPPARVRRATRPPKAPVAMQPPGRVDPLGEESDASAVSHERQRKAETVAPHRR